ncbi:HAD family hydrolase [Meiothermus rufus]|uniref:HAD family hydrolase n=1 Tax=Meiothermus rufus TaxID=604332 RepID=UPI0003F898D2|nr:HAD family hydrolase [Meiothermus rufus]
MHWLTFDLDGTLADWPFRRLLRPYMQPLLEQPHIRQALREEYLHRLAQGDPIRVYDWGDIHRVVQEKLGLEPVFPPIPKLLLEAALDPGWVYPEVPAALAAFQARGYRIAIATNGLAKYQQVLVDRLAIPYDRMLAPDLAQAIKPQPAFWQPVLNSQVKKVVHVGDLLSQDIWGANQAGLTAVWIWRSMPEDWRRTPVHQRTQRKDLDRVIEERLQSELAEHGLVGQSSPNQPPQPDHIVADLEELLVILK